MNALKSNCNNYLKDFNNTKYFNNGVINYFSSNIDSSLFDGVLIINNTDQLYLKNAGIVYGISDSTNEAENINEKSRDIGKLNKKLTYY